ncbi:hypothetical protein FAZ15_09985 [Sphingobacterium olei]|uniref:Uncharacterized protein n=1 Tax=Sphingobacterium olei TaxID=2571155 RepID=A0A4U0P314_9SPHI|nr:hypothetical protein [Sphingobacterium olei]TJZ61510.1 hypothetical protein FAZ15_09985 [Sphingobacterium olei]
MNNGMVIEQSIKYPIDKEKLIDDLIKESTSSYQEIMEKSTADVDEYVDDYEELEQIPIFILDAVSNPQLLQISIIMLHKMN